MELSRGPLEGVRVLELGSSVAGPFCGRLFADFEAYESAFSLIEPHVPAFAELGIVANRAGARLPDSAPNNTHLTQDERWRTQLQRSRHEADLDQVIGAWIAARPLAEVVRILNAGGVPSAPIYTIADIFEDEHFRSRDMLLQLPHPRLGSVTIAGIVPELSETPGRVRHAGGDVGQDTEAGLREVLGLPDEQIQRLKADRIVHGREPASQLQELEN